MKNLISVSRSRHNHHSACQYTGSYL